MSDSERSTAIGSGPCEGGSAMGSFLRLNREYMLARETMYTIWTEMA